MVERRTPEREVGVRFSLRSPCCVLEQDTFTSQKVLNATLCHLSLIKAKHCNKFKETSGLQVIYAEFPKYA